MRNDKKPPIICLGHLGLGDHIITNGLVNTLAVRRKVYVPCKAHNYLSVIDLFAKSPNVSVIPIADDDGAKALTEIFIGEKIRLGLFRKDREFKFEHWDRTMYEEVGVDFSKRWTAFRFGRTYQAPVNGDIFVHHDPKRGFTIPRERLPIGQEVKLDMRNYPSILSWLDNITRAREIHCIDSSFACLVDSLPNLKAKRLVLHLYARPNAHPPTYKKPWEII